METSTVLTPTPAEAVTDAAQEEGSETAPEAIVVRFGGARYAVPMADVAEVVPVPVVTRVPGSPGWLTGVVNWRGRVLAVVDLRPIIGDELIPLPFSARLVVLTSDSAEVGLLVEAVTGLLAPDRGAPARWSTLAPGSPPTPASPISP